MVDKIDIMHKFSYQIFDHQITMDLIYIFDKHNFKHKNL